MGKSAKDRVREYRERKRLGLPKPEKVPRAQRVRSWRERRKAEQCLKLGVVTSKKERAKTSTERSQKRRALLANAKSEQIGNWTKCYLKDHFFCLSLDSVCDVCDRIWWSDSTITNNVPKVKKLLVENGYIECGNYNICKTCNASLMRGKIPQLATCNGFVYPPVPPHLPELDPITERLISPRLPFLRIQQIRYFQFTNQLIGQIINVPMDVNETVKQLPRDDDATIHVQIKKKILHKSAFYRGFVRRGVVKDWLKYLINTPLYKMHNIKVDKEFLEQSVNKTLREESLNMSGAAAEFITPEDENRIGDEGLLNTVQQTMLCDDSLNLILAPGQNRVPNALSFDEDAEELSFPSIYYGIPRRYRIKVTPFMMTTSELRRSDRRGVVPEKILYAAAKIMRLRVIDGFQHMFRNKGEDMKTITREQLSDVNFIQESLDRNLAFMQSVPNSMQYWSSRKKDLFAMMRQLGKPTIFLTFSASEIFWPNLLRTLLKAKHKGRKNMDIDKLTDDYLLNMSAISRVELVNNDPVTCNLYFSRLVDTFIFALKMSKGPFRKYRILDYFKRIEFQHRGSAHCHTLLWLDNVPDEPRGEHMPLTTEMIDQLMTTDNEALKSFRQFQTHRHTFTCNKNKLDGSCRFGAPFWPMRKSTILWPAESKDKPLQDRFKRIHNLLNERNKAGQNYDSIEEFMEENMLETEEEYLEIIRNGIQRPTVFLRRNTSDIMTNSFNPEIAEILQSNMDIQFILDEYSCASYVAEYVNKSDRGFSSLHRELIALREEFPDKDYEDLIKEVGKRALSRVEMPSQEAAWFLLRLPMSRCSRQVRFIPTQHPSKRFVTRKTRRQMDRENLTADSTDIWQKNIIERYEERPPEKESLCLADFVSECSWYKRQKPVTEETEPDLEKDYEENDEESSSEEEETCSQVLPTFTVKRRRRAAVIRYVNYDVRRDQLNYKRETVLLFHPFRSEELDLLNEDAYMGIYDSKEEELLIARKKYESGLDLVKIAELARMKHDFEEKSTLNNGKELNEEEWGQLSKDLEDYTDCISAEERDMDFNTILSNSVVRKIGTIKSHAEFCELMRTLNDEQRALLMEIIYRLIYAPELGPLQIFFTGPAGSGKSYVLKTIMEAVNRFVMRHDTTRNAYIACGTTGKSSVSIGGQTAHSVFRISFDPKRSGGLPAEKLQTMRCDLREISYIIIDEISMASYAMLRTIDSRLRSVRDPHAPFGGFNIVMCGDLRQLKPVRALPPYTRPANLLEANMPWHNLMFYGLNTVVRQEDTNFSRLLTKVGSGDKLTRKETKMVESRFRKTEDLECFPDAIRIFLQNKEVDEYNNKVLEVDGRVVVPAIDVITGNHGIKIAKAQEDSAAAKINKMTIAETGNMSKNLPLVLDRPYMITQNMKPEDKLVNGTLGNLKHIEYHRDSKGDLTDVVKRVWLQFEDKTVGEITRLRFKHYAKEWNLGTDWTPVSRRETVVNVNSRIIKVSRRQFPLVPACAITVHKSQGQTYERVVYEYDKKHETQLTYVALSRGKSIEGMYLTNKNGDYKFYHAEPRDNSRLKAELSRLESKRLKTVVDQAKDFVKTFYISCVYLNVQSLHAHYLDVLSDEILKKIQVLMMAETWMDDKEVEVELKGFRCVQRYKRPNNIPAGGVAIYESLESRLDSITPITNDHFRNEHGDVCCALIDYCGKQVALVCIYASVGTNLPDMKCLMDCALWRFSEGNAKLFISQRYGLSACPIIVGGDLNVDWNKTEGQELLRYVKDTYGVTLAMDQRVATTRNRTSIDYVLTRGVEDIKTFPYVSYFSVHRPILFGLGSSTNEVSES